MAAQAAAAELPGAPETLPVVSLVNLRTPPPFSTADFFDMMTRGPRPAEVARQALERHGALVLELPPDEAETLKEALAASDALFAPRTDGDPATQLIGGKALVEYRSGADVPTVPAGVAQSAERAHACLFAAGRNILRTLYGVCAFRGKADTLEGRLDTLDELLNPTFVPRRRDRRRGAAAAAAAVEPSGSPSVLTWLQYDAGAQAAPHTDRGLLTLVFAEQAGLEVRLRDSGAWVAPPVGANTVLLFAGECLQLATGNFMRACVHRVVPGAVSRRSLVMRMRAHPDATLPLVFGQYWRCATVREFNARFAATHSSVNEPLRVLPSSQAAASRVPVRASARRGVVSLMETLLALPELAAAIAHALGDDAKALASAELVCRALRDAVAPHWLRICLACGAAPRPDHLTMYGELRLPSCIVATDARQWCALLGRLAYMRKKIDVSVKDMDTSMVTFKIAPETRLATLFDAYCMKKQYPRDSVRFMFWGNRAGGSETVYSTGMENGDCMDAMMEQVGD